MAHTITRREFDCEVNGAQFFVVTVCGVITECSDNVKSLIGRDLVYLKAKIKEHKHYNAVERRKEQKWIPTTPSKSDIQQKTIILRGKT